MCRKSDNRSNGKCYEKELHKGKKISKRESYLDRLLGKVSLIMDIWSKTWRQLWSKPWGHLGEVFKVQGRRNSRYTGPKIGSCLIYSRNIKGASRAGVKCVRQRTGDLIRVVQDHMMYGLSVVSSLDFIQHELGGTQRVLHTGMTWYDLCFEVENGLAELERPVRSLFQKSRRGDDSLC